MRRLALIAMLGASVLAALTSSATAAVSVGQLGQPFPTGCGANFSYLQPAVTSGPGYASPVNGTLRSWSVNPGAGEQLQLKVFRRVGGNLFQSVGRSALHTTGPGVNVVPGGFPISAGDFIGLHNVSGADCVFSVPGETYLVFAGDLNEDGVSGLFTAQNDYRVSVSAVIDPANRVTIVGGVNRDKDRGTARLTLRVPNPGTLVATGKGVRGRAVVTSAGDHRLTVKAKGAKRTRLLRRGKVELKGLIRFTPTGGDPAAVRLRVKLLKR